MTMIELPAQDPRGRHGGVSRVRRQLIWTLPGVRETRTYAVMEEVKNTTSLAF